jgi:hypothetical protein
MKYKKIITCGCSFSDPTTPYTWPNQLEAYITKNIDSTVRFDHRGLSSQGQELIQRKACHAIFEALETGYKPDEIAVFVMWSSVDRKSFYVDNPDSIDEIVTNWKGSKQGWNLQFADLKNQSTSLELVNTAAEAHNEVRYNKAGGWFITSGHVPDEIQLVRDYFMLGRNTVSVGICHDSLQNILALQYLCQSKGIRLYQQYYMDNIIEDLARYKDHQIVKYLYDDLDKSTFISDRSIHNYMDSREEMFVGADNSHPNGLGHRIWLNEVVLPRLEQDNFFD